MISTRHALAALALATTAACTTASNSSTSGTSTAPVSTVLDGAADSTTTTASTTTSTTSTTATTSTTTDTATTTTSPTTTATASTVEVANDTTTTSPEAPTSACVASLSTRAQVALLVWPAVYSADWDGAIATVRESRVGGVLLMEPTGVSVNELATMLSDLESASAHGLIVATDEEGGAVQRLRFVAELASQRQVSQEVTPAEARQLVAEHGALIRDLGIDMVFGPVIDVEPNVGGVPLQASRFFDGGPADVARFGEAYLNGWNDAGLFATLKHYPGHGAASGDTHITAGITPSLDDLAEFDLLPYRELVQTAEQTQAAVMVGHLTVPGLTDGLPATRSSAAVDHLRNTLGYSDTLLITDALGMAAVGLTEPEASVLALQAGLDIVLFTQTSQTIAVIDAIEEAIASGDVSAEHVASSAAKVMDMLGRDGHSCNKVSAS